MNSQIKTDAFFIKSLTVNFNFGTRNPYLVAGRRMLRVSSIKCDQKNI